MSNRILNVELLPKRATPAVAELWIIVTADQVTPTTEVRGKLVGPRHPGISTVEIAYPLRETERSGSTVTVCATVPEPNLWTQEAPFVYAGVVELWQDGVRCDHCPFTTSFKSH